MFCMRLLFLLHIHAVTYIKDNKYGSSRLMEFTAHVNFTNVALLLLEFARCSALTLKGFSARI